MNEKNSLATKETFALAVQNHKKNNFKVAENLYKKVLKTNPNHFKSIHLLGSLLIQTKNFIMAIQFLNRAILIQPKHAATYNNLGAAFKELGEYKKSITYFQKAIEIQPNYAEAHNNFGMVFEKLGEFQKAVNCYQQAIQINPNYVEAHNNLGIVFEEFGQFLKAISCYKKAVQINPNYSQSKLNEAYVRLALGELEIGWKMHESRFDGEDRIKLMRYQTDKLWDGNYLDGTLLVWAEQGVGDHILFASMLTDLRKYAKNIILEIDKRLVNLCKRYYEKINFSNIKVINLEKKLVTNFDKHIALGSLGQYLRKTKKSFETTPKKYLTSSPVKEKELRNKFFVNKKFKVGISWKSLNEKRKHRNIDLTQMLPILSNPHCDFINLQFGKFDEDLQKLQSKHGIKIRTIKEVDNYNNIEDLAALINCLDLVINIQNSNADLAGALGQNTWVMVTKYGVMEWRWAVNEKKSLWYPTTKLFRQEKAGDWNSVVNSINMDLIKLVK